MAKKAVLIGINYPGTEVELNGCINDVWRMHNCLIKRYGFSEDDITVLIDNDNSYTQPTGKNIKSAITTLIGSAKPGDILFVHYSGHGVRLPAETGEDDDTGYDECIVPCDMNLITDHDFKDFVDKVPRDCKLTFVSDSCHSGGLIEETKEQIGETTAEGEGEHHSGSGEQKVGATIHSRDFGSLGSTRLGHRRQMQTPQKVDAIIHSRQFSSLGADKPGEPRKMQRPPSGNKKRSLPLSTLIDILKEKTGKDDIDVGKLRPTLFDVFGEDASPKVKKFLNIVFTKIHDGDSSEGAVQGGGNLGKAALETHVESKLEVYAGSTRRPHPDGGILMSGCQSDQISADADPYGDSGKAYGAFSNAIQAIIEETDGVVTNSELVMKAGEKLEKQGYTQKPGLYCSDHYVNAPFLR